MYLLAVFTKTSSDIQLLSCSSMLLLLGAERMVTSHDIKESSKLSKMIVAAPAALALGKDMAAAHNTASVLAHVSAMDLYASPRVKETCGAPNLHLRMPHGHFAGSQVRLALSQ